MKIAVLTTENQWFEKYAVEFSMKQKCALFFSHENVQDFDIVFILSYHKIIPISVLKQNKHNIVIHESPLPTGKGWAPLFWQILEGKNEIIFTMFEVSNGVDNRDIYMQRVLKLDGYELNEEIREKQAKLTMKMCYDFIENYEKYKNPMELLRFTTSENLNFLKVKNSDFFFKLKKQKYILSFISKNDEIELWDFTDLNEKESKTVLQFRNHKNIRKWMYNDKIIDFESHLNFVRFLISNPYKQYLLVKKTNYFIGVIDFIFNFQQKEVFWGIYANPIEKQKGNGKILANITFKYIFDLLKFEKITLDVFSDNIPAIEFYKKNNFKAVCLKKEKNKDIICMELTKQEYNLQKDNYEL